MGKIQLNWKFGLFLILLVCVPRFYLVLEANKTANYSLIGLIMLISALLPFVFLNRKGLFKIGVKATKEFKKLVLALLLGLASAVLLYLLGHLFYGATEANWFQYIGRSYNISEQLQEKQKLILFAITSLMAMLASPIGEEFFFRGIVHHSFAKSLGVKKASFVDSLAFALVHLAHFGVVYMNGQWQFFVLPSMLWLLAMFVLCQLFFKMKQQSKSIWGAVICHAGFNLGMVFTIFYGLF